MDRVQDRKKPNARLMGNSVVPRPTSYSFQQPKTSKG